MRPVRFIQGTFLSSRFGRRIFLMFCIAAIVPAATVFWMTYRTAVTDAQLASRTAMVSNSKNFALSVFERLETAYQLLERIDADSAPQVESAAYLRPVFSSVVFVEIPLHPSAADTRDLVAVLGSQPDAIASSSRLLVIPPRMAGGKPSVVLLRPLTEDAGRTRTALVGTLRPSFLWGLTGESGSNGQMCVHADGQRLFCDGNSLRRAGTTVEAEWSLFLKPRFGAPAWLFVTTVDGAPILKGYSRYLALVAVGVLLLVLLLSSIQIRRVLVPMESLLSRIRSLGQGQTPIEDHAVDDEFGALTHTFNDMGRRIGLQMETLRMLSEVDRLILERVPLTAVVDVVIAAIRNVLGDATIGVILPSAGSAARVEYHLLKRASLATEVGDSPRLAPVCVAGGTLPEISGWLPSAQIGPALQRDGVQRAFLFPVGVSGRNRACVLLGFQPGVEPSAESLTQAGELGERIAVAMAADEREELLIFQARHDPLTKLPNRLAAFEALSTSVQRAKAAGDMFAAVFIDLDRFKSINDGLGHALGDKVLVRAGERITQHLRSCDFVARFGGDEFFLILQRISSPQHAVQVMEKIARAFSAPLTGGGDVELFVDFSAGIALYPRDGNDADALIQNSDVAMYRAKKSGGGRIEFFDETMGSEAQVRVQLENDLRAAIKAGELRVHYQPRVDSRDGRIVAVEALARWTHPAKGVIPPTVFIPVAEECGLIESLGAFVLDASCRQLAQWKRQGIDLALIAVNVSTQQLRSGKFVEVVRNSIESHGIGWHELEIEVTESLLIHDSGNVAAQLRELRRRGVTVAIDDFGTGYSSLAYLSKLPIDTLKIDRAFMAEVETDKAALAVIRAIIVMAHALGKTIVAEGVESMAQVEMLGGWGCHIIQGFVYYPPQTPEALSVALA